MKILLFGNSSKESGGPAQVMKILKKILENKYNDEVEILDINTDRVVDISKRYY